MPKRHTREHMTVGYTTSQADSCEGHTLWAARCNTWLLIGLTLKGVVFSFLFFSFLFFSFLFFSFLFFSFLFFLRDIPGQHWDGHPPEPWQVAAC